MTAPSGGTAKRNTISRVDIKVLLGKDYIVGKMMRFLREIKMFEEM